MTDSVAPDSLDPFEGVEPLLRANLVKRGFTKLTPIQTAVVQNAVETRNLRLTSQTGSGKTVAIGLAVLQSLLTSGVEVQGVRGATPTILIIVPTRELAQQLQSELFWLYENVRAARVDVVTGGTDVRAEVQRLRRKPSVIVGTPGRLLDHVSSGAIDLGHVREVVLDEADQMLDMGFKDELDALVERLPEGRRSHLVSATFPRMVEDLAQRFQADPLHLQGSVLGQANHDIQHVAHLVRDRDRYAAIVNVLLANHKKRCLVFVQRRVDAAELSEMLAADGFAALPISGDLPQAQRNRTLASFKNGLIDILVATDVAARGIHVDDVALVIHADLPKEPDVYTHRSGRTGRAGQTGKSIMLVTPPTRMRAERLLQRVRVRPEWEPVPTPKKIQQSATKLARKALHAALEGFVPESSEVEYAQGLLAKYSPEAVIASLLRMTATKLPREPMPVEEVVLRPALPPARGSNSAGDRPAFASRAPRGAKPPERPHSPKPNHQGNGHQGNGQGQHQGKKPFPERRGPAPQDSAVKGPAVKRPVRKRADTRAEHWN